MGLFSSIASAAGNFTGLGQISPLNSDIGQDMLTGGAVSNAKSVSETNQKQMELADKQMAFQERMSNSAYQRAMEDMKRAGLNPSLAYQNGGSSTPTGAMATLNAPRKGDIGAGLANSAKAALTGAVDLNNTQSQTQLNKANEQVADVSAQKITATAKEIEQNTELLRQRIQTEKHNTKTAKATSKTKQMEADLDAARFDTDKKLAPADAWGERILQAIGGIGSAFRNLMGGRGTGRPSPSRRLP